MPVRQHKVVVIVEAHCVGLPEIALRPVARSALFPTKVEMGVYLLVAQRLIADVALVHRFPLHVMVAHVGLADLPAGLLFPNDILVILEQL